MANREEPVEQDIPPECCGDIIDIDEKTGRGRCPKCGNSFVDLATAPAIDPAAFTDVEIPKGYFDPKPNPVSFLGDVPARRPHVNPGRRGPSPTMLALIGCASALSNVELLERMDPEGYRAACEEGRRSLPRPTKYDVEAISEAEKKRRRKAEKRMTQIARAELGKRT